MIDYLILCENETAPGVYVRWPLLNTQARQYVQSAVMEREIDDGMFVGKLTISIIPGHPEYDTVELLRSTIYVFENDVEVFRGRAISVNIDRRAIKKIVCESDMKFLIDVPDKFSKIVKSSTSYFIGREDSVRALPVGLPGLGLYNIPHPLDPTKSVLTHCEFGKTRQYGDALAPYYGPDGDSPYTLNGQTIELLTSNCNILTNHYDHGTIDTEGVADYKYWQDCGFGEDQLGMVFTVEWGSDTFYVPLFKWDYYATCKSPDDTIPTTAWFIGNILLPHPAADEHAITGNVWSYFPVDTWRYDNEPITAIKVTREGHEDKVNLTDLPFCIVNYDPAWIYKFGSPHEIHKETVVYVRRYAETGGIPTQVHFQTEANNYGTVSVRVSLTTKTQIGAMYYSIFYPYQSAPAEQIRKGYNLFADEKRKIYRGTIDAGLAETPVEHNSIETVYSDLQKWLSESGGYARIRKYVETVYVIDLMADTGINDDSFYILFGDNVSDWSAIYDNGGIATGIYVFGTYDDGKTIDIDRNVNVPTGYTLEDRVIWNDEARQKFGNIVTYHEMDLESVPTNLFNTKMVEEGVKRLKEKLLAAKSFTISAIDPRLRGAENAIPTLGNYYPVLIPIFKNDDGELEPQYLRLSKIVTDMIKPSGSKLTFGSKIYTLTDYVAKNKGERK